MKRRYKVIALYFSIMFLIMLFVSPSFPVQADIKTFSLDDSFEDIYYNKIYNQYTNRTKEEYTIYYNSTFRPNEVGNTEELTRAGGGSYNYEAIDEIIPDDDTTYLTLPTFSEGVDTYNIPNPTDNTGDIINITLYIRVKKIDTENNLAYFTIRSEGTNYYQLIPINYLWNTHSYTYFVNPADSETWEWEDLDALEIGVKLDILDGSARVTQVYLVVNYFSVGGKEFFYHKLGDGCDFEEDKEEFSYWLNNYMTDYSDNVINGKYVIETKKLTGSTVAYIKYEKTVNFSTIHWDKLEIRIRINNTFGNPHFYLINQHSAIIWSPSIYPTTEWQTFTREGLAGSNYRQTSLKHGIFLRTDTPLATDTPAYKLEIEYIKIWRNNFTDYATKELEDSWDFDEGDKEGFTIAGSSSDVVENGYLEWIKTDENPHTYIHQNPEIDYNYYDYYVTKVWSNSSDYNIQCRFKDSNDVFRSITIGSTVANTWVVVFYDLGSYPYWNGDIATYKDTFGILFREKTVQDLTDKFRVDYLVLNHDDFEGELNDYQEQTTSFTRARHGLKSFYHNYKVNDTFPDSYIMNYSSHIIIDFVTTSLFVQKFHFTIYTNFYFTVSLFLGTTEYLLHTRESINNWLYVGERIEREDYILNSSTEAIYLKITPTSFFYENQTCYIDDLEVTYTDVLEDFSHSYDTRSGSYQNSATINATNSYFNAFNSGEYATYLNSQTLGYWYAVQSNDIFTRRMKLFTKWDLRDGGSATPDIADIYMTHRTYINLTIDKEYYLYIDLRVSFTDNLTHNFIQTRMYQYVYVDNVLTYYQSDLSFIDELVSIYFVKFSTSVQLTQTDHHTFTVYNTFANDYSGNKTSFRGISFSVNEGNKNSGLNVASIFQNTTYMSELISPIPPVFKTCKPEITQISSRDISHSSPLTPAGFQPYQHHVWGILTPFRSLWQILVSIGKIIVDIYNLIVNLTAVIEEIKLLLSGEGGSVGDVISSIFDLLGGVGETIGDILSAVTGGFGNIGDLLSGIGGVIDGNFFDNMFSPFADSTNDAIVDFSIIDEFQDFSEGWDIGDWSDMEDSYVNFVPTINPNFLGDTKNMWGGFWINFVGEDISQVPKTTKNLMEGVSDWLTILICIYLVWLAMLIGRKDWDRMSRELSRVVRIIVWMVSAIMKIIHWIFEIIWALLDVLIPFT